MSSDDRDFRNIKHFLSRSSGKRRYMPAIIVNPNAIACDCWFDPQSGAYCQCSPMMTSEMLFGQSRVNRAPNPTVRFASPAERAAVKRRQMIIAQSTA